jgi:hypothetical protein
MLCLVLPAHAVPVVYDEEIDGDLTGQGTPLHTFTFDVGLNTISGRVRVSSSDFDPDSFAFVVPAGLEVSAASVALSDEWGDWVRNTWRLSAGSANFLGGTSREELIVNSPGLTTFTTTPLAAGTYNVSDRLGAQNDNVGESHAANYVFSFTVVPEPAAVALFTLAAAPLLWRRRQDPSRG